MGTVVQSAATAANGGSTQPVSNWPSPVTSGNLLIAFGYIRNNASPSGVNGWSVLSHGSTANWYPVTYYKYATSGTAQAEAVDAGTGYQEWGLSFWEISGVTGTIGTDVTHITYGGQNGGTTTPSNGSLTTQTSTLLVLGGYSGQFPSAGGTMNWSGATGWTHDADYCAPNGDAFGVHNWASGGHQAVTGGAVVSLTISVSQTPNAWTGGYVEITFQPNATGAGRIPGVQVSPVTGQALINGVGPAAPLRPPLASLPIASEPSVWTAFDPTANNAMASKFIGYAVVFPPQAADASKFIGYAVLGPPAAAMASKFIGYAVLGMPPAAAASKFIGYAVIKPGGVLHTSSFALEVAYTAAPFFRDTTFALEVAYQQAINVRTSTFALDVAYQQAINARTTTFALEVAYLPTSTNVRTTTFALEVAYQTTPNVRTTTYALEVAHSYPKVPRNPWFQIFTAGPTPRR